MYVWSDMLPGQTGPAFSGPQVDLLGPQVDLLGPQVNLLGSQVNLLGIDVAGPRLEILGAPESMPLSPEIAPDLFGLAATGVDQPPSWYNQATYKLASYYPSDPGSMEPSPTAMKWAAAGMAALMVHSFLRLPLTALACAHGYKRTKGDGGSTVGWGVAGFIFPISTTVVSLFQGWGKPKAA